MKKPGPFGRDGRSALLKIAPSSSTSTNPRQFEHLGDVAGRVCDLVAQARRAAEYEQALARQQPRQFELFPNLPSQRNP